MEWHSSHYRSMALPCPAATYQRMADLLADRAERDAQIARLSAQVGQQQAEVDDLQLWKSAVSSLTDPWLHVVHLDSHQCVHGRFHTVEQVALARVADHATILTLRAERDAAQQLNREWLAANAPGGWIDDLRQQIATLTACKAAFDELYATVQGECPSLLDPDRGGSDVLWNLCDAALQSTRPQEDR